MHATYPGGTPSPSTCPLQARGDTGPPAKDQQSEEQTLVPQPRLPREPRADTRPEPAISLGIPPQNHEVNDGARKLCPHLILAGPDVNCILVKVPKLRGMTSLCVWTGPDHWALQQPTGCTLDLRLCGQRV